MCEHDWDYNVLGMFRTCRKCGLTQGNHVEYGWVEMVWRNQNEPPSAIRLEDGQVIELTENLVKGG